jgi:hypothetical protein
MGVTLQSMSKWSEFRKEAAALRDAAEMTESEITRATLLKLAEEFDRMAANPVANYPKKLPRYIK